MSDKPREFWIRFDGIQYEAYPTLEKLKESHTHEDWHTVEYAAYLAVLKERDELYKVLRKIQFHGIHHYEDCSNREYDDQNCNCGMEQAELAMLKALEKIKPDVREE